MSQQNYGSTEEVIQYLEWGHLSNKKTFSLPQEELLLNAERLTNKNTFFCHIGVWIRGVPLYYILRIHVSKCAHVWKMYKSKLLG